MKTAISNQPIGAYLLDRTAAGFQVSNWLLPRLGDMLFAAIFLAVIGLGPRLLNMDGDLGRHLTIGEYILANRTIPTADLFSHTLFGQSLTPHEWLAQVIFGVAYRIAGLDGVVWLSALIIAATFALLYRQCSARSGMVLVSLVFSVLAAGTASLHWLARPHLFTMLLMVIWMGELAALQRGEHQRWWHFPLIMLLWANLHAGYLAGFIAWGIWLAAAILQPTFRSGRQGLDFQKASIRPLLLAGISAGLVTLINPVSWHLWTTGLRFLGSRYLVGHTAEYLSPDFQQASSWPFLLMIMISILLLGFQRFRQPLAAVFSLAGWTVLALYSARNIPLYAIVAAPILAGLCGAWLRESGNLERWVHLEDRLARVESPLRGKLWPLLTMALVGLAFYRGVHLDFGRVGNRFSPEVFPVQAVGWIAQQNLPAKGFNYFPWGGYLLYRLWPEQRVFIDGQTDFYGEELTRRYETLLTLGPGWREWLDHYDIGWVLMPSGSALVGALQADPEWAIGYQDATATVVIHAH